MNKIIKFVQNPLILFPHLGARGFFHGMDDATYLKKCYRAYLGKKLNLENPKTFNEKLQWLKLHDRNPLYTTLVDKAEVKPWVAERIGSDHIVPTLGVWDSFEEIDFDLLPDRFVLKCTHDSGGLVICRDKNTFDVEKAKSKIKRSQSRNFYWSGREWPYKNVKPRILAEEYLESAETKSDLTDYKIMCFGGRARCEFTYTGRAGDDLRVDFFDTEWNHLPFIRRYPNADVPPEAPSRLGDMLVMAERLAEDTPFVRADFYEVSGELYFGELTFYPGSGMEEFSPERWDDELGSWIELPESMGYLIMSDDVTLLLKPTTHPVGQKNSESVEGLVDYKFYCFYGEPQYLYVSQGLEDHDTARISFLSLDWSPLPFQRADFKPFENLPEKPAHFDDMLVHAKILASGIPFVRVDFYEHGDIDVFSEMTFNPCSGFMPVEPCEADLFMGSYLELPF